VSLRSRLLVGLLGLVSVGLLVAGVATYRFLDSFLIERVDRQLEGATDLAFGALNEAGGGGLGDRHPGPGPGASGAGLMPGGTYAAFLDPSGDVIADEIFIFGEETPPPPSLPPGLPGSTAADPTVDRRTFTATSGGEGSSYRVLAQALGNGTLVVAIPLTDVQDTLQRLLGIEVLVAAAVLVGVAALALWVVRIGLRPLERMGETAGAIASGDPGAAGHLSRRVEPADRRTEVGRLGLSLNAMLAQIERAFEERRASEERLRRFVADASHELRTPLTSIRGYAELFRRGAAERPQDLAMAMRRIEQEGSRMGELVEELLLLARLDQGRPLEREPVDLAEVVGAAVEGARAAEPDRPIDLQSAGPVVVLGDAARLRQVIDNLLANAREHTPEGTPVHVSLGTAGSHAVLEVGDEGPGIPDEDAGRVFERFYRADESRSRALGGVGLGLSIVAAVTEALEGRVTYESAPRGGALFRVALPLARDGDGAGSDLRKTSGGSESGSTLGPEDAGVAQSGSASDL
jgi:two-component system, OmpR family, sensor kinase